MRPHLRGACAAVALASCVLAFAASAPALAANTPPDVNVTQPLSFVLSQGSFSTQVQAVERAQDAAVFYNYFAASSHTGFEKALESKVFLYRDTTTGQLSLFFTHGIDFDTSGIHTPVGAVTFDLSGVPPGAFVAQSDDPFQPPRGQELDLAVDPEGLWNYQDNTDGGVIDNLPTATPWCITITPERFVNINSWVYHFASGASITLNRTQPVTICFVPPTDINVLDIDEGNEASLSGDFDDPDAFDSHVATWDFGDGDTAPGTFSPGVGSTHHDVDPTFHTYGDDGSFDARLTVDDSAGGSDSDTVLVRVKNLAPSGNFSSSYSVPVGVPLAMIVHGSDPGSDDLTFSWDFDDGTPSASATHYNDGVGPDPYPSPHGTFPFAADDTQEHVYCTPGTYTVTVDVKDDDGGTGVAQVQVAVSANGPGCNQPPACDAGAPQSVACGPVQLHGSASDPDGDPVTVHWTSSCTDATFTPSADVLDPMVNLSNDCARNCTFTITVTDGEGASCQDDTTVTFDDTAPPVVSCPQDTTVECDGAGNTAQEQAWKDAFIATDDCSSLTTTLTVTPGVLNATINYDDFCDLSALTLNGSTAAIHGCTPPPCEPVMSGGQCVLRLTNDLDQSGSAFVTSPISLASDASFSTFFSFRISDNQGCGGQDGADGLVFVVQTVSNTAGGAGSGIGYEGISNSVGVEFDTFNNGAQDQNNGNHVGIDINGSVSSNPLKPISPDFNNGNPWYAWVDYDGVVDQLEVRVSTTPTRPATPDLTKLVDLLVVLGTPDAYVGFTSGTGCAGGDHDIRSWFLNNSYEPIGCGGTRTETAVFTATDACGNESKCQRTFTIEDTTPPEITPGSIAACYDTRNQAEQAALAATSATDTCSPPASLSVSSVGTCSAIVTVRAVDACGNASTHDYFTRVDSAAPVLTCPADKTVECNTSTDPSATGTATATDDCDGGVAVAYSDVETPGSCPQAKTIKRTWKAEDTCGHGASCVQTISVVDSTAPVITCPTTLRVPCDQPTDPSNTGTATATDNCDTAPAITFSDSVAPGACPQAKTITRTWTATDACSNSSTCVQTINVVDRLAPVITCPANATVECDQPTDPSATGTATATDNCDPAPVLTFSDAVAPGSCPQAKTISRTWTATDACTNASSCVQTITVRDTKAPAITCPANVTVECDQPTDPSATGTATATDNCDTAPAVTFSDAVTPGSCPQAKTISRTWTATDACTNASSCVQTITVRDTKAPAITCPANVTVECDQPTDPSATGTATATDNCDTAPAVTFSDAVTPGSCPQAKTISRTWTATDACTNASSCVQTITVRDTKAPAITCPANVTVECDQPTDPSATGTATATDNCDTAPAVTFSDAVAPGSCPQAKTISRTWTATDACTNASTCVQTITVRDTTAPVPMALLQPAAPLAPQSAHSACASPTSRTFRVTGSAKDNCDPNPALSAKLLVTQHDVPVKNGPCVLRVDEVSVAIGELVEIHLVAPPCPAKPPKAPRQSVSVNSAGVKVVTGEKVVLRVTATDACGNTARAEDDPASHPSPLCDEKLIDGTCCPAIAPPPPDKSCKNPCAP